MGEAETVKVTGKAFNKRRVPNNDPGFNVPFLGRFGEIGGGDESGLTVNHHALGMQNAPGYRVLS